MQNPKTLYIQMANQCNNQCTTCIFFNDPEYVVTNEFMSDKVIEAILKNIEDIKTIENIFYGPLYGENQTHPKFYDMVRDIKKIRPNISVGFLTNGKLITEESMKLYKGDAVYISILGNKTKPETYESITGLKWDDLKLKAQILIDTKIAYYFYINVSTFNDLEEIIDSLKELPNFICIYTVKEYRNLLRSNKKLSIEDLHLRFKHIKKDNDSIKNKYNKFNKNFIHRYSPREHGEKACMEMLNEYITITSHGDILICPCDTSLKSINGNIQNNSILDLFNNTYMKNIRSMVKSGVFPKSPCLKNCSYQKLIIPGIPSIL